MYGMLNNPHFPCEFNKKAYMLYHTDAEALLENRQHAQGSNSVYGKDKFIPL